MKEAHKHEVLEKAIHRFEALKLEPQLVPHDSVNHLRGCLHCINLTGSNVDSALIFNKVSFVEEPKYFYRVDYAVRGTLRGIPSQRDIVYTKLNLEGFLRKKLQGITWKVPEEQVGGHYLLHHEGSPPMPGEVWEEGPHPSLIERLNGDLPLMEQLMALIQGLGEPYLQLTLSSDSWGESIRLRGSLWVNGPKAIQVYASPAYIQIADGVLGHLREVRSRFGGLTF